MLLDAACTEIVTTTGGGGGGGGFVAPELLDPLAPPQETRQPVQTSATVAKARPYAFTMRGFPPSAIRRQTSSAKMQRSQNCINVHGGFPLFDRDIGGTTIAGRAVTFTVNTL